MSYPGSTLSLTRGIQANISTLCMFMQTFSIASRYLLALSGEEQVFSPWLWLILLVNGGWEIKLPEEQKLICFLDGCSHHWATVWTVTVTERLPCFQQDQRWLLQPVVMCPSSALAGSGSLGMGSDASSRAAWNCVRLCITWNTKCKNIQDFKSENLGYETMLFIFGLCISLAMGCLRLLLPPAVWLDHVPTLRDASTCQRGWGH